jgi:penicillin-binding protein 1A
MIKALLTIKRNFENFFIWNGCCWFVFPYSLHGTFGSMPSFEDLENPDSNLATEIISADGVVLEVFRKTGLNYTMLIYQNLVQALIATEDARFYEHSGIDGRGT